MYRPAPTETGKPTSESNSTEGARPVAAYGTVEPSTLHTVLLAHSDPDGLRTITQERCAALLTVAGRPLAEHTLDSLRAAGISSALVVLGPHAEQVERVFGTGERWGLALDYLRVPEGEQDGAILARLGAGLGADLLVLRCDVLRSPMVDRFLAAARARPGTSAWAAIEGVPAGMALIRREDVTWLDLPTAGGQPVWEQLGQPIQFRDATLCRIETVGDFQRANRVPSSRGSRPTGHPNGAEPADAAPRGDGTPARPGGRHIRMGKFDYLIAQRHLTRGQLGEALNEARRRQVSVESVLLEHHGIREADLAAALSLYYRCPYVSLDGRPAVKPELLAGLQRTRLRSARWLPIKRVDDVVTVAVDDPHDVLRIDAIEALLQPAKVTLVVAVRERILRALDEATGGASRAETSVHDILGEVASEPLAEDVHELVTAEISENDSMVVRLANQVVLDAHRARASDIHL